MSFSQIDLQRDSVFLVGDFNATSPSWLQSDTYNSAGTLLEPLFLQLSLQQLVTLATHFHPSCHRQDPLLDLVLSSSPAMVSSTPVLPPLGNSDHGVVRCLADLSLRSHRVKSR